MEITKNCAHFTTKYAICQGDKIINWAENSSFTCLITDEVFGSTFSGFVQRFFNWHGLIKIKYLPNSESFVISNIIGRNVRMDKSNTMQKGQSLKTVD